MNAEETKEMLIEEDLMEKEYTVTLTRRELIALYYTCAHSEMLYRERSIGMKNGYERYFNEDGSPKYEEEECRREMKAVRILQGRVSDLIPDF